MKEERAPLTKLRMLSNACVLAFIAIIFAGVWFGPTTPPSPYFPAIRSACKQNSRAIGLALYAYANDHNGRYPDGKTSTEVFQQLIDEKYVADPMLFYVNTEFFPGKVRPQSTELKAENVCWDVTCCVDSSAPEGMPVVFLSRFSVSYKPGAAAISLPRTTRTWLQSQAWYRTLFEGMNQKFIAAYYKNNTAVEKRVEDDGSIPNFIPADFDAKGKVYRQLTP